MIGVDTKRTSPAPRDILARAWRQLRRSTPRRVLAVIAGPALVALVVLYHAILLWQRVADLTLLEPAIAARWLATLLLLLGLFRLHHRGVPLIWGRKALVFWLLVLLLHVSFYGPVAEGVEANFDIQGVGLMLALPATVVIVVLAAVCLALLAGFLGVLAVQSPPAFSLLDAPSGPSLPAGWTLQLASRPPPA